MSNLSRGKSKIMERPKKTKVPETKEKQMVGESAHLSSVDNNDSGGVPPVADSPEADVNAPVDPLDFEGVTDKCIQLLRKLSRRERVQAFVAIRRGL